MSDLFSEGHIRTVYENLKRRKFLDREKSLPIGIDGMSSVVFDKKLDFSIREIQRKLILHEGELPYTFAPLLRITKNKPGGGARLLHIPRLRDQIVLRIVHDEIRKKMDEVFRDSNLKEYKSPYLLINDFDTFIQSKDNVIILKTDLSQFYDSVPRKKAIELCKLLNIDSRVIHILSKWSNTLSIRQSYMNNEKDISDFQGLPQGLSISSLLAELYAKQIDSCFKQEEGFFRFVDDILIVCSSFEEANWKLERLKEITHKLELTLSKEKTEILNFESGVKWLGLTHFPDKKVIQVDKILQSFKPIRSLQKQCLFKINQSVDKEQKMAAIEELIRNINKFVEGRRKVRLRWYALCDDHGQWKDLDKYIHGVIRSCIRRARISEDELSVCLPSIHAKVYSFKKMKESQKTPTKGDAPNVS